MYANMPQVGTNPMIPLIRVYRYEANDTVKVKVKAGTRYLMMDDLSYVLPFECSITPTKNTTTIILEDKQQQLDATNQGYNYDRTTTQKIDYAALSELMRDPMSSHMKLLLNAFSDTNLTYTESFFVGLYGFAIIPFVFWLLYLRRRGIPIQQALLMAFTVYTIPPQQFLTHVLNNLVYDTMLRSPMGQLFLIQITRDVHPLVSGYQGLDEFKFAIVESISDPLLKEEVRAFLEADVETVMESIKQGRPLATIERPFNLFYLLRSSGVSVAQTIYQKIMDSQRH